MDVLRAIACLKDLEARNIGDLVIGAIVARNQVGYTLELGCMALLRGIEQILWRKITLYFLLFCMKPFLQLHFHRHLHPSSIGIRKEREHHLEPNSFD
jgi:hypothetical protein